MTPPLSPEKYDSLVRDFKLAGHLDESIVVNGVSVLAREHYRHQLEAQRIIQRDYLSLSTRMHATLVLSFQVFTGVATFPPLIKYIEGSKPYRIQELSLELTQQVVQAFSILVVDEFEGGTL
jgi:hypothetical protein